MSDSIYPRLPTDNNDLKSGNNFRLTKVDSVLKQLDNELKHYDKVRKKYTRVRSICQTTAAISGGLSTALTTSGIATSLTGPGIIVGIPLSTVGGVLGILSAGLIGVVKKLTIKVSKHEKTVQLIKSKHNSISDLISKALHNNVIDEKEFELIMSELNKYEDLKRSIRKKSDGQKNYQQPSQPDINVQKLKEELKKEFLQKLQIAAEK